MMVLLRETDLEVAFGKGHKALEARTLGALHDALTDIRGLRFSRVASGAAVGVDVAFPGITSEDRIIAAFAETTGAAHTAVYSSDDNIQFTSTGAAGLAFLIIWVDKSYEPPTMTPLHPAFGKGHIGLVTNKRRYKGTLGHAIREASGLLYSATDSGENDIEGAGANQNVVFRDIRKGDTLISIWDINDHALTDINLWSVPSDGHIRCSSGVYSGDALAVLWSSASRARVAVSSTFSKGHKDLDHRNEDSLYQAMLNAGRLTFEHVPAANFSGSTMSITGLNITGEDAIVGFLDTGVGYGNDRTSGSTITFDAANSQFVFTRSRTAVNFSNRAHILMYYDRSSARRGG